jgi:hypothetical protein
MDGKRPFRMPKTLAQWTGVAVTAIVVSGSDIDLLYAIPLGIFAGALATFFSSLADSALPASRPTRKESN